MSVTSIDPAARASEAVVAMLRETLARAETGVITACAVACVGDDESVRYNAAGRMRPTDLVGVLFTHSVLRAVQAVTDSSEEA